MKYKIEKSDLFINNKLHPEGSEIELTKEQTKGLEEFLIPVNLNPELTEGHPVQSEVSETKVTQTKIKGNKK